MPKPSSKADKPYAALNNVASLYALNREPAPTSLSASATAHSSSPSGDSLKLPVDQISLPLKQPRQHFDPDKLSELAASIQQYGILEPLVVRPKAGGYELVAGERRLKAAQMLYLEEVPVVVHNLDDQQALQVALIENLQREGLNPIEETQGILSLLELTLNLPREAVISLFHWNARQQKSENRPEFDDENTGVRNEENESHWLLVVDVFKIVGGLSPAGFRTHRLPLLNLPESIVEAISSGKIEYSKAQLIARIKDESVRDELLEQAVEQGMSREAIGAAVAQALAEFKQEAPKTDQQQFRTRASSVFKRLKSVKLEGRSLKKAEKLLAQLEELLGEGEE